MPRIFVQVLLTLATIALILTVPILYLAAASSLRASRTAIADACAAEIRLAERRDAATVGETIERLKRRYDLPSIGVMAIDAVDHDQSVNRQYRVTETMQIRIDFPPGPARLGLAMVIAGAGSAATILLVFVNVIAASRPGSQSSSALKDENLFRTFGMSLRTLKEESARERERAAELETVANTLVRSITSGVIAIDAAGLLVDVNSTGKRLLGLAEDAPIAGRSIADALGETEFARILQTSVATRQSLQRVETSAAEASILGLTTVPLFDESRRYLGMLALFTDLVPIRQLETRVREMHALADLGEMSAGIAHELRNSLGTVLGYLQLVMRSDLSQESRERVQRAEREARQLNAAMENFLAYARPMRIDAVAIELRSFLEDIVNSLRPLNDQVRFAIEGPAVEIRGDPSLLARAFGNVIRNSIEAIAERGGAGTITIQTKTSPPTAIIADDGIGIRPEDVPRLFLPFQSTKMSGSGLGLSLAKKIVLLHGGSIRLDGAPDRGATATVELVPSTQQRDAPR